MNWELISSFPISAGLISTWWCLSRRTPRFKTPPVDWDALGPDDIVWVRHHLALAGVSTVPDTAKLIETPVGPVTAEQIRNMAFAEYAAFRKKLFGDAEAKNERALETLDRIDSNRLTSLHDHHTALQRR